MHAEFLQDLAVVMIVAGVVTLLFQRLRQPVVLGYIVAGMVIGPHTPPFPLIHDQQEINTLAELGLVFLMFSLGLEFNLRKLRAVGSTALVAAVLEIVLMAATGYQLGRWFGWSAMDSLFLGAMLSISSTTIIVKALGELGLAREGFASVIFGILVIEDILAIVMIALLSGIALTGSLGAADAAVTIGRLAAFLGATLVGGLLLVPRLLAYVGRWRRDEMLLITVLGLCFGCSLLAVRLGYSVALGAFLIGAVVSESREIGRIERLIAPLKDMFSAVFFVAIGLLIDPRLLLEHAGPILAITAAVILGKVVSCALGTFITGHDVRTSLRVGMGLAQIGEFSFIIAALGLSLKVTSDFLYPIAVAVSALTTLATPYLIRSTDQVVGWFDRTAPGALVRYLGLYTRWVGRLGAARPDTTAARWIRRCAWTIGVNLTLIAAVFIVAAYLANPGSGRLPAAWLAGDLHRTVLWLSAIVLTLPLFLASFRKLQALGLILAESNVTRARAGDQTDALRGFVAQAVTLAGTTGLALYGFTLSSPLLPPGRALLALLVAGGLVAWLLRRAATRVYARAQFALQQTLADQSGHGEHPAHESAVEGPANPPAPVIPLLTDAHLRTVVLRPGAVAARRLIRELALRTCTGATIVGIDRPGQPLLNPGPEEEILAGDRLILLGAPAQLDAAEELLGRRSEDAG